MSNPTKPNIKFAARPTYDRKKRKILSDPQPQESFSDRGEVITLPPAAEQKARRLFFHEKAAAIVAAFPKLYKHVTHKPE